MISNLKPHGISGFVDGEECFFVGLNKSVRMRVGIQVLPEFIVVQHQRDRGILYRLKNYFCCGNVRINHGGRLCFRV
jgi:hypothetical protein